MRNLPYLTSFRQLMAYQKAREVPKEIYLLTKSFPSDERYSLTDQMRRSSRSVGAQIAEAWAKRFYEKHFLSKLTDADGEQQETQHWIEIAVECRYISTEKGEALLKSCEEVGRLIGGMMTKSSKFCRPEKVFRESIPEYLIP